MKKIAMIFIILLLYVVVLAGCTIEKKDTEGSGVNSLVGAGTSGNTNADIPVASDASGEIPAESVPDNGTIKSLDEIRQNAAAAGYGTEDMLDIQKQGAAGMVEGFNLVIGNFHTPVMEFSSPADAQVYADDINAGGYYAAIVNGRFLTMLSASKGVIADPGAQTKLEEIMDAKAQVQENWEEPAEDIPSAMELPAEITDYHGAYALTDNIGKSMAALLDQALKKNNKAHPEGDSGYIDISTAFFLSMPLSCTAFFGEDEQYYEGVEQAAVMLGGYIGVSETKMERNAANNYSINGKRTKDGAPYEIHGVYDPGSGSLHAEVKEDGKTTEFFEFVPLGDGVYALQTNRERAVVKFVNGETASFLYSKLAYGDEYNSGSDSIYPGGGAVGTDASWAAPLGEDGYEKYYSFNGSSIRISNKSGKVKAEIPR